MTCRSCGADLQPIVTDLPFKVSQRTIVILKGLPVLQCERCCEYAIEDAVMQRVEEMLSQARDDAELQVFRYAA